MSRSINSISSQVAILAKICTRNEAGRHFTEVFEKSALDALENAGLIIINRPTHEATGMSYGLDDWSVEVTDQGIGLVENNPEDWDLIS